MSLVFNSVKNFSQGSLSKIFDVLSDALSWIIFQFCFSFSSKSLLDSLVNAYRANKNIESENVMAFSVKPRCV